ncbi:MAG TPA: TetR/AcrR family transcriptional regulator [Firmicutes bacterium]|jgi:AcrR family transcriptional regulator|nr:TetR/AcrR family transcriptional regulator [Bacillota bacterium]HOQ24968.1 helix-turn-helix domain-containing protein [Bacillota bacterium]HPT68201.1 helix-turn-helix domain-containing protein [Bacillota bacterium]
MKTTDSKEKILDIALKLFVRRGYHGTSLNDIARKAGLTKGGIYHYFSSKEDLYRQVLAKYFKEEGLPAWVMKTDQPIRDYIWSGFSWIERSKKEIQGLAGSKKDDVILCYYNFLYEATRKYPEFQRTIDTYDERKREWITKAMQKAQAAGEIRADISTQALAFELDALLQQLQYLSFVNPQIKNNPEMFRTLFENYWLRLKA